MAERSPIVRLYGRADNFDIEFTHKGGTTWTCDVPPDTRDGVYAVELTAINAIGYTAYWTGELYMVNGVCHLMLHKPRRLVWFRPKERYRLTFRPVAHTMQIRKRCTHV